MLKRLVEMMIRLDILSNGKQVYFYHNRKWSIRGEGNVEIAEVVSRMEDDLSHALRIRDKACDLRDEKDTMSLEELQRAIDDLFS